MTSSLRNLLLVLGGLVIGVVVAEVGLSVIARTDLGKILPAVEPVLGMPDPDTGYAFIPNAEGLWTRENRAFIKINSLGLRDVEISKSKPADTKRLLISGDSVIEALQVDQTNVFDQLAESALRKEGFNFQFVNMAMSGNGPLRQLTRLEKLGRQLEPDAIVMFIHVSGFLNNELTDDSVNPAYKINDAGEVSRSFSFRQRFSQRYADHFIGRSFRTLQQHSHVFRLLNSRLRQPVSRVMGVQLPKFKNFLGNKSDISNLNSIQCPAAYLTEAADKMRAEDSNFRRFREAFFGDLNKFSNKIEAPIYVLLILPLPRRECSAERSIRYNIMSGFSDIAGRNSVKVLDWENALSIQMALNSIENQGLNPLLGFGANLGGGHLNYLGHKIYALTLQSATSHLFDHSTRLNRIKP
jgi:hypothetical protein